MLPASTMLEQGSIDYQHEIVEALLKSWPELKTTKLKAITVGQCLDWASRYAAEFSASRYNNTVDAMRKIFDLASAGVLIAKNPEISDNLGAVVRNWLQKPTLAAYLSQAVAGCRKLGDRLTRLALSWP